MRLMVKPSFSISILNDTHTYRLGSKIYTQVFAGAMFATFTWVVDLVAVVFAEKRNILKRLMPFF